MNPRESDGSPSMCGPSQAGQRDHRVRRDHPVVGRDERVIDHLRGHRVADELDAGVVQETGERVRGDRAEEVERARFRCHDGDLRAVCSSLAASSASS